MADGDPHGGSEGRGNDKNGNSTAEIGIVVWDGKKLRDRAVPRFVHYHS